MAKFLTTTYSDDYIPVSINVDMIVGVEDIGRDDCCMILMVTKQWYRVNKSYEDVVKNLTPFIPFDEMCNKPSTPDWMNKYLSTTKGESDC